MDSLTSTRPDSMMFIPRDETTKKITVWVKAHDWQAFLPCVHEMVSNEHFLREDVVGKEWYLAGSREPAPEPLLSTAARAANELKRLDKFHTITLKE